MAIVVAVAIVQPPLLFSQQPPSEIDRAEAELEKSIEQAAAADSRLDRVEKYKSIRVPDAMIEIAPAEEHFDLVVHNRFITTLRANILATPPAARAKAIVEGIDELAEQKRLSPIETFPLEQGVLFVVGDQPVLAIAYKDLDLIGGETLEDATAKALTNLELALSEMVELRNPERLVAAILRSLTALLLFCGTFWILQKLKRWVDRRLLPHLDRRMGESLSRRLGSSVERSLRFLSFLQAILTAVIWALFLGVAYLWLTFSLKQFPYTRPWGETLGEKLLNLIGWFADGTARAIPGVFVVLVILFLARAGSRLLRALFEAVEQGRLDLPGLHADTAQPTRRIVNTLLWLIALVVAYPYFPGSSSAAFKGLSVFIGLVISLGSTGIVNQAMSGLMVMYARALRVGDFVRVGEVEGTVTHLGMLSTKVRSLRNEEITVPNAVVISRETINYSRYEKEGVTVSTTVTIGYDTPWRIVENLLKEAARRTEGLRSDPPPFVLQTALSDYYPEYRLMAVVDQPSTKYRVLSKLHEQIQDLFHGNGIQIMSPHYVADPEDPKISEGSTD